MLRRLLVLSLLTAAACNKPAEPESQRPAPISADSASPQGKRAAPSAQARPGAPADVTYDVPSTWQKSDKQNPMRKATYTITRASADSEDAELSVSQAGGSVELNIKRWAGQFQPVTTNVPRNKKTVGGLDITMVELHGTYSGMAMPGLDAKPKDGWALLGAIVETSPPTFFKLTGPEKTVVAARADFEKLVDSMKAK